MSELQLDPLLLTTLGTLQRHDVQFILVGSVAEAIYNHGGFVAGVTIVPAGYGRNVERLVAALQALEAELSIDGTAATEAVDWRRTDVRDLAPCTFATSGADVDLDFEPAATRGYQDLFDEAAQIELAPGISPLVASLEDLERVGRAAAPDVPYAQLPVAAAPEPRDVPHAQPPAALPPEPDDGGRWPDEIRASRPSRTRGY